MKVFVVVQIDIDGDIMGVDVFNDTKTMHAFMDEVEKKNDKDLKYMHFYEKDVK